MEKILNIEVVSNCKLYNKEGNLYYCDGYVIKTNLQEINIGISNGQDCCEYWGYITSEDNFKNFIGAELLSVEIVDGEYKSKKVNLPEDVSSDDCVFVNVQTSEGTLQFVLYNVHNGYYGHSVIISSNQIKYDGYL